MTADVFSKRFIPYLFLSGFVFLNHTFCPFLKALLLDCFCGLAIFLSAEDIQFYEIPLWPILLIALSGVIYITFNAFMPWFLPLFLLFLLGFGMLFSKKIGVGDLAVMAACSLWFNQNDQFSSLLILSAFLGIFSHLFCKQFKIPFTPHILFSAWILYI
jgi:Flp pilus assembly protein protease CpaA